MNNKHLMRSERRMNAQFLLSLNWKHLCSYDTCTS